MTCKKIPTLSNALPGPRRLPGPNYATSLGSQSFALLNLPFDEFVTTSFHVAETSHVDASIRTRMPDDRASGVISHPHRTLLVTGYAFPAYHRGRSRIRTSGLFRVVHLSGNVVSPYTALAGKDHRGLIGHRYIMASLRPHASCMDETAFDHGRGA